jgi:hypothetical protein
MSLGTHVGPHNGDSPLEEYIVNKLIRPSDCFLVAAAGNDGGSGVAAKRNLRANERDFLKLNISARCKDLLVEFWWDDAIAANLTIELNIYQPLVAGGSKHLGMLKIGPGLAGTALNIAPVGLPANMTSQSLFQAKCRNNLDCIAFSISASHKTLPVLEVKFGLESASDVVVNAWIVVCEEQPQTAFVEGEQDGTIRVPASHSAVLGVAGTETTGQLWEGSSRGPAARFQAGNAPLSGPLMAHLAALGGDFGTSYSSPRACADAIAAMADPAKLADAKTPST